MTAAWLIGLLSTTFGIGIGGGIAWSLNGFQKSIATVYALCGGLIVGLVGFEILPEALQIGDWITVSLGFVAGILLFELLHQSFHQNTSLTGNREKDLFLHTSILLIIGISLHNLPMGVVLGATNHSSIGMSILPALILHNIPEGIILFTPLFMTGKNVFRLIIVSIVVALPVALGAFIGSTSGMENPSLMAFSISFTVGAILMIAIREVFMESIKHSSVLYCFMIALLGTALIGTYFHIL